ncbi:MAG: hypothetical protein M1272_07600 [Firmicutes bacterium]|nr:hypothetical protein [Bacillota bacterium]
MMAKSVPPTNTTDSAESVHFDWVKWIMWSGITLAVAVGLSGLAFLAGYLTAFHNAAKTIQSDHALIVSLNQQLQTAHTKLANRTASNPPVHGSWWLWWLGLPFQHLTHTS